MAETVIKIENVKKKYRLGVIGGRTLTHDLQSWWARKRGKEDPNSKIGSDNSNAGESFYALNGIDLEVKKGEALGIIGPNGAGKSTLLKLLSRVTAPTEGRILIKGRIASMLEVGTGFHSELTGRENIYMNGAILGMTKAEIDAKMESIIDFSECRQFIDTPVKRYSSGMYVKLAFAVAAHLDAEIMIMDEVLAVGDMKFQEKCLGKMGDSAENEGKTILYVSHNMNTIRKLCNRCIVLEHGRIIFQGKTEDAIKAYMNMSQKSFPVVYDTTGLKRANDSLGKKLLITKVEFKDKEGAIYKKGECIKFEVTYRATEALKKLQMYCPLKYADSTPVCLIETGVFAEAVREGEVRKALFRLDLNQLVAGDYYFFPTIFTMNSLGAHESLDQVRTEIMFRIIPDESSREIRWSRDYWGSIRFGENNVHVISDEIVG